MYLNNPNISKAEWDYSQSIDTDEELAKLESAQREVEVKVEEHQQTQCAFKDCKKIATYYVHGKQVCNLHKRWAL